VIRRRRVAVVALSAAIAVAGSAIALKPGSRPPATNEAKPSLLLLTSLPILFGEGFQLDTEPSPVLARLERDYRVEAIAAADRDSLARGRLLLMAQPRAQPAELLVALDQWVHRGGRLLLLADPHLDWPSEKPLGDLSRPPASFADTGLLGHWGLELAGPQSSGPAAIDVGSYEIAVASAGRLASPQGRCVVRAAKLIAHCRIEHGRVTVIADADFLNLGGASAIDGPTEHNLDLLESELVSLSRPD
jgi:hypothetical protein